MNRFDLTGLQDSESAYWDEVAPCEAMGGMWVPRRSRFAPFDPSRDSLKTCRDGSTIPTTSQCPEDITKDQIAAIDFPGGRTARSLLERASQSRLNTLHAGSRGQALQAFDSVQIKYANDRGRIKVNRTQTGLVLDCSSFIAEQHMNTITLNGFISWGLDLDTVFADVLGGAPGETAVYQLRSAVGAPIKNTLTNDQFRAPTLLHELGHRLGRPQEAGPAYNKEIFENCIK